MALGVIAYLIGGSITVGQLRRMGRVIFGTMAGETLGAVVLVFTVVLLVAPEEGLSGVPALHLALAFGAIAVSTAPAATVAVLHQYHARGPLSTALLGVVALDDALGIVLFALMAVITTGASLAGGLQSAGIEVGGSLLLGAAAGYGLNRLSRRIRQGGLSLPMILAVILLTVGGSETMGLSPLLSTMVLGFTARMSHRAAGDRLFAPVEYFEELVFLVFFTMAGAHFDPQVFVNHLDLITAYFFARLLGKMAGASAGAHLGGAPQSVSRWLGLGLAPQAGVAVGLALTLVNQPAFHAVSALFVNVVLGTTLLYELTGPILVRVALGRAGEMGSKRRRAG
jgi:Kef-type K+ transport system membrane component KefB